MTTTEELLAAMRATAGGTINPCPPLKGWPPLWVRPVLVEEIELDSEAASDVDAAGAKDKRTLSRGAARVICNEQGERLLNPKNEEQMALLDKQTWARLQKVLAAAEDNEGNSAGAGSSSTN